VRLYDLHYRVCPSLNRRNRTGVHDLALFCIDVFIQQIETYHRFDEFYDSAHRR